MARVGITGTLPPLIIGSRTTPIRLDVRSNQAPGAALSFCPDRAKHPDGRNACRLQGAHKRRVNLSQQRRRDGSQRDIVRHPQAVDELRFHVHPFEHARDLLPPPCTTTRPVASQCNDFVERPPQAFPEARRRF